jgi:hypothetical protein
MRFLRSFVSYFVIAISTTTGCAENLPSEVPLAPGADAVEVVSDPPNADIYEACGGVTARVAATEVSAAVREAKNELRNQAAAKKATFVSIDETASRPSWDLRGRTVVTMTGTAYRQK